MKTQSKRHFEKKDGKLTTKIESVNDEHAINKKYLYISRGKGSYIVYRRRFKKFIDLERSNEEALIERTVKTTIQILYDNRLFNIYDNAGGVIT